MSYVNDDEKSYVITYKELIFTIFVFIVILVALYPKDLLKQQIISEKSNYDLSMLYLKALLKQNPNDESLMFILAQQSQKSGNRDLALRLAELLLKSKNEKLRKKATLFVYELQKENYFFLKDEEKKRLLHKKLKKLFWRIYFKHMYNDDIEKWYKEAVFVGNSRAAYNFLKRLVQKDPQNVQLLTTGYYYSLQFHDEENSNKFVDALIRYDTKKRAHWVLTKYYTYLNYKRYDKAEAVLKKHAEKSLLLEEKLAEFYLMRKRYREASKTYLVLYKRVEFASEKKQYLIKAIRALQGGNLLSEAADLAHRYERNYIYDIKMRNFLLKLYMATGRLDYADKLSRKILKLQGRR